MIPIFKAKTKCGHWIEGNYIGDDHIQLKRLKFEIQPETLSQFTGKLDKSGTRIFANDLLIDTWPVDDEFPELGFHESLLPVTWCEQKLQWCVDASFDKDGSYLTSLTEYFGEYLHVKGNKYD